MSRRPTNIRDANIDSMANVFCLKDMDSQHNGLNGEFLLYQVILKRLLTEGLTDSSIQTKLLDYFNPDDETDRQTMMEFDKTYKSDQAIQWYTRESCIYRLLNKALRTHNIGDLIVFTQFIRDLFDQLSYEQVSFFVTNPTSKLKVYRGQLISKDEINRIKHAKGELLSMKSFLSTSTNRAKAIEFATNNTPTSDTLTTILLEINLDLKDWSKPYADIKNLSAFAQEDEVLFMFGCIFRIDDIWEDKQMKIWRANLTLCGEGDKDIQQFQKTLEKQLEGKDMLVCLGGFLMQMQKFDEAQIHYEMLLNNNLVKNSFDLATCYYGLAQVNEKKGEYDDSIKSLNLAINYLLENSKTKDHSLISQCYNHFGLIYCYQQNETLSFKFYDKALKTKSNNPLVTYDGLSKLHFKMENYQIALEYQYKCLDKQSKNVSSSNIANTLVEIGKIYGTMNEYHKAVEMFERALEQQRKALSSNHPDLGYTYIAMGIMFSDFGQETKAFDCIQKAFKLQSDTLPNNHLDFGETFKNYGLLCNKKSDFDKALYWFNELLINQRKTLSWKHPSIAETYSLIGNAYLAKNNIDAAIFYFDKLLNIQIERLPSGNPSLTETYKMIAKSYLNKKDFDQSLIYFNKLLNNELERKVLEDPSLADTYKMIANIYLEKQDFSRALIYFYRFIDTQLQTKEFDKKEIINTYTTIGNIYLNKYSFGTTLVYFGQLSNNQSETNSSIDDLFSDSFKNIADIHFEKRHLDQVFIYFEKILEHQLTELSKGDPLLNSSYKILGNIYLEKQNFDKALIYFYKLLNNQLERKSCEDPSLADTYKIIANYYFEKKNYQLALSFFYRFIYSQMQLYSIEHPSIINAYKIIGKIYSKKNLSDSIDDLSQLTNKQPFIQKLFLDTNRLIKNIRFINYQIDQSLIYFHKLLSEKSTIKSKNKIYFILSNIYLEKRDYDNALLYLNKLIQNQIQINPFPNSSLADTYAIMANVYFQKRDFKQALKDYRTALTIYKKVPLLTNTKIRIIKQYISNIVITD